MMDNNLKTLGSFLLFAIFIDSTYTNFSRDNDSSIDFVRQPRIQGRIVKLYSGIRPETFLCPHEGFLPDPKDCAIFYRCVKGARDKYNVFRFQCGPGTIYDPDTEICNHPQRTKRYECGTGHMTSSIKQISENDIYERQHELPSPIITNLPVYNTQVETDDHVFSEKITTNRPVYNKQLLSNRPTHHEKHKIIMPLYVDELTTGRPAYSEQFPSKSEYVERSTTSKPLNAEQLATNSIITSSPVVVVSANKNMSPTAKKYLQLVVTTSNYSHKKNLRSDDICTSNGFIGDTENCRKFYRCVGNGRGGFIKYEFSCSESTIWDDSSETCNHPWAVKKRRCGALTETKTKENETHTTIKKQLPSESIQEQTDKISALKVTHNIDDSSSTKKYFKNDSANYDSSLLQNNVRPSYDETTKVVIQKEIKGNKNLISGIRNPFKQYNSTRKNNQISTLATTTASRSNDKSEDNKCISSGFMGDEKDCKKFYRCVDNGGGKYTRYEFSCGEGTVWDSKLEACNHAWAVESCGQKTTDFTTIASTTSVQNYYTTIVTTINQQENTSNGNQNLQLFSTTILEATTPLTQVEPSKFPDKKSKEMDCISNGFMGNPKNCKIFYRCVDSGNGKFIKYEYLCGEGTVWDSTIQSCNHIWAAKTCKEINDNNNINTTISPSSTEITTVSLIQTTTEKITESDDYDIGYGEPHFTVQPLISTTAASDKQKENIGNQCQTSGFIGDKDDCKKFYRCIDNGNGLSYTRYEFSCGEGTVWDPDISACNHQWAVKKCGHGSENNYNKAQETTVNYQYTMSEEEINSKYPAGNDVKPNKSTENYLTSTISYVTAEFDKDSICKNSGFMEDTHNCKKFYRCVDDGKGDFIRFDFLCGEGTIWDKKTESCNHEAFVTDCRKNISPITEGISTSLLPSVTTESNDYLQSTEKKPFANKSELNNTCTKEGFIGDNQDCKKFYRCVYNEQGEFIMYQFNCGDGTVWDSAINACNHEMAVKSPCSGTIQNNEQSVQETTTVHETENTNTQNLNDEHHTTSTRKPIHDHQCVEEGFFENKYDCKKFYRCVNDGMGGFRRYEFSCGEGTVWDQDIKSCNHEKSGHSCDSTENATQTIEANHNNDEMYIEDSTKISSDETDNSKSTTSTQKPQQISSNNCTMEGFFGDSSDCKKFYRCVTDNNKSYTKYEFMCGDGTVWDQKLQTCNYKSSDKSCSNSFSTSSSETVRPQTEALSADNTSTTEYNASPSGDESDDSSVGDDKCNSEGFFANSKDCKKFYRCVSDEKGTFTKYDFSCGDGTVWVQAIQACDHDNDVNTNCDNVSQTTSKPSSEASTEMSTSSSLASIESDKEHDEYPDESSSQPTSTSEMKCSSEGFFPNPMDCTKFYRCVDNSQGGFTKYDFTCGEGTAWDINIQTCNHLSEVDNCKMENGSSSQSKPVTEDNETTNTSDKTETDSNEPSKPVSSNICEKEGYFGNENDCKKFYRCVDNGSGGYTKYDYNCGEGTIWDQDITTCNHPQDVTNPSCKTQTTDTESSTAISTTSMSSSSTNPSAQVTDSDNNNQNTTNCNEDSSKKPGNKNITCTKAGFYEDPNDCTKFYRCVDWNNDGQKFSVFHFTCGEGTIWDPELDTCNHEDSVFPPRDCSGSQSQNENINEASTTDETSTEKSETTTSKEDTTTISTEKSTKQDASTSEQTTKQSTTEKTTTEKSTTTTEQTKPTDQTTTTEKSTTESTSTQKSTTSEQTTSEKTTSQPIDSNEDTTTQQSTESSTTKKSTTEKTATDDQSNTDNLTTTEESTTSEQTTTEQSTTSEQPTTEEKIKTTDKTSTEQSTTTEEQTSQESTTGESTTQESSTEQQSTTDQSTTEDSQNSTTEETSSSDKDCPDTDDDQYLYVCPTSFRRHPKYCNLFYQCLEDDDTHELKIATFNCPNNTIYDETKTQCVEEKDADKKCEGETAQRRRVKRLGSNYKDPIVVSREKRNCPTEGHFPFEKKEECSPAFFKCKKSKSGVLRGFVYRCPEGYMYWSISRRCELSSNLQHCSHNDNDWRGRLEIPTERKNIS